MKIFVFGIGGTGARVLRSLTMLLASGVKINQQAASIIPIIIDTDAHNGDTARTHELLRDYNAIRRTFLNKSHNKENNIFFNTEIKAFNTDDDNPGNSGDIDVQFNFQNQDTNFANFIGYNSLSEENKNVIELLYNDSLNNYPELYLNLSKGFKGNPNIGSIVFNDLANSEQFRNFASGFNMDDRVFIISSIFGGTGSSGFPTLIKMIRTATNNALANAKIGAITVMPYFNVTVDDKSAINSALFDTKTKSALSFYSSDAHINSINALYYIADNKNPGTTPNVEGGEEQVNNAHVIELISAMAVVDFINKQDTELLGSTYHEFGIERNNIPISIADFARQTKEKYLKPLTAFAYASKIGAHFIPGLNSEVFYGPKELNIANELGITGEYNRLLRFFVHYMQWCSEEMNNSANGRPFNSFRFDDDKTLNAMIMGKIFKTTFFDNGLTKKKIGAQLSKAETALPQDMPLPEKYMNTLYATTQYCLKEFGELP